MEAAPVPPLIGPDSTAREEVCPISVKTFSDGARAVDALLGEDAGAVANHQVASAHAAPLRSVAEGPVSEQHPAAGTDEPAAGC